MLLPKQVITDHGVIHKLARLAHTQDDLLRFTNRHNYFRIIFKLFENCIKLFFILCQSNHCQQYYWLLDGISWSRLFKTILLISKFLVPSYASPLLLNTNIPKVQHVYLIAIWQKQAWRAKMMYIWADRKCIFEFHICFWRRPPILPGYINTHHIFFDDDLPTIPIYVLAQNLPYCPTTSICVHHQGKYQYININIYCICVYNINIYTMYYIVICVHHQGKAGRGDQQLLRAGEQPSSFWKGSSTLFVFSFGEVFLFFHCIFLWSSLAFCTSYFVICIE